MQVSVNLTNVVLNDLTITITSPTGVTSTLMYHPGGTFGNASSDPTNYGLTSNFAYSFGTVADRAELEGSGKWTLNIADDNASGKATQASLISCDVTVTAGPGTSGQTYIYTDGFGDLSSDPNNAARGTLVGTGYNDTLRAAAVSAGSIIDLTPGSTDSFIAGRSVTIGSNAKITTACGGDGDDTFIVPTSTSVTLQGDRGNDTYQFSKGFGQDTIINGWSANTGPSGQIVLGAGLDPGNLWLSQSGNNRVIQALGTTGKLTVTGWYVNGYTQLKDLTLADGYQLTTSEIASLASAGTSYQAAHLSFNPQTATSLPSGFSWTWPAIISGTSGTTNLVGTSGDDVFAPGPGNDTFTGDGGNDVYRFAPGAGQVTILNGISSNTGPTGELALLGLTWSQVWFTQSGTNLVIGRLGSSDRVTIENWFNHPYSQLNEIVFGDGSHIGAQAASALATAGSNYAALFLGFNSTTATMPPWSQQLFDTIANGGSIAGLAADYFGSAQGQVNLYVTGSSGQLATWAVSGQTIEGQNVEFSNAYGGQSVVDPAATVIGAGEDYFGSSGRAVFLRGSGGQLSIWEFDNGGSLIESANLALGGQAWDLDTKTTMGGGGEDYDGLDGRTTFLRLSTGQVEWLEAQASSSGWK